ncbi:MAG: hypothetical protein GY803_17520 [Chloroflexi bacterium]|nr:hypothetical protein [Chloroflexota bacterium]
MNRQISVYADKRLKRLGHVGRRFWQLTVVLLSLAACSLMNGEPTLGSAAELQGQAVVTCSAACAERGQCGRSANGDQVVLGGQGGPAVENHDRVFAANTAVPIYESRMQRVEPINGGEQFDLRFYHIQRPDGADGWVAGWCLAAQ